MPQQPLVLIVEDDTPTREYMVRVFQRKLGFATIEAEGNSRALSQALQLHPHLITTDMFHPDGSGLLLIQQIRANASLKDTPIIMISCNATEEDRRQAELLAPTITLYKPATMKEIMATVRRIFPQEQPQPL